MQQVQRRRGGAPHWRRVAVVSTVAIAALLGACGDDDPTSSSASVEEQVAFIDNIVPHHEMANMMADDALAKATRPWLRDFAQRMKVDQTREIAQYREIRDALTGVDTTPPPMETQPMPGGADFDRRWILMMVAHHQGAINNSTLAHGTGVQSRLDSLAHHTIEEQREEQAELLDSLEAWYGGQ